MLYEIQHRIRTFAHGETSHRYRKSYASTPTPIQERIQGEDDYTRSSWGYVEKWRRKVLLIAHGPPQWCSFEKNMGRGDLVSTIAIEQCYRERCLSVASYRQCARLSRAIPIFLGYWSSVGLLAGGSRWSGQAEDRFHHRRWFVPIQCDALWPYQRLGDI